MTMIHRITMLFLACLLGCSNPTGEPSEDMTPVDSKNETGVDSPVENPETPRELQGVVPAERQQESTGTLSEMEPMPPGPAVAQVIRQFYCVDSGIDESVATTVLDSGGHVLVVRLFDRTECLTHLYYVWPDGLGERLTESAAGYGFSVARAMEDRTVVCVSRMDHSAIMDDIKHRHIDTVTVECTVHEGGEWSPLTPVVVPDGEWAAWIDNVLPPENSDGLAIVEFRRDFVFHPFDSTKEGRPDSDGMYRFVLRRNGTELEATNIEKTD